MVRLNVRTEMHPRLRAILADIVPETRRALFSVGANALRNEMRRHLRAEEPRRHVWADRLGASPTGHLSKGAARIVSHSSADRAEVVVPIAGLTRAYHDLTIRPVAAKYLTVPIADAAYGHRVRELSRMGWKIFRMPGTRILAGRRDRETKALYALREQVPVPQDRSLLPSDGKITSTINDAIARRIQELIAR